MKPPSTCLPGVAPRLPTLPALCQPACTPACRPQHAAALSRRVPCVPASARSLPLPPVVPVPVVPVPLARLSFPCFCCSPSAALPSLPRGPLPLPIPLCNKSHVGWAALSEAGLGAGGSTGRGWDQLCSARWQLAGECATRRDVQRRPSGRRAGHTAACTRPCRQAGSSKLQRHLQVPGARVCVGGGCAGRLAGRRSTPCRGVTHRRARRLPASSSFAMVSRWTMSGPCRGEGEQAGRQAQVLCCLQRVTRSSQVKSSRGGQAGRRGWFLGEE